MLQRMDQIVVTALKLYYLHYTFRNWLQELM